MVKKSSWAIIGIQALDSGKILFMNNDIEGQGTKRLESGISFILKTVNYKQ